MIVGYSEVMNFDEKQATNFKKQIEAGQKIHTFRKIGKREYEVGDKLHHTIHMMTPEQATFSEKQCTGVQKATFHFSEDFEQNGRFKLYIDGRLQNTEQLTKISKNDGFSSLSDFGKWFWHSAQKADTLELEMQLIHWGNLRY